MRRPFIIWMSLTHAGDFMSKIADILSGLASIPRWATRYPKNFSEAAPKVHFSGFNFTWYFRRIKRFTQVPKMIRMSDTLDHVIDAYLNGMLDQIIKYSVL